MAIDSLSQENFIKSSLAESQFKRAENAVAQPAAGDAKQRRKIAEEFSSLLYLEVLKAMRAATAQDGAAEGEALSRDLYISMMDAEVARLAAKRDTSGFSKAVERALDRMSVKPSQADSFNAVPALPSDETANGLRTQAPATGTISSGFGPRADPFTGSEKFHDGVDIAAPSGAPVKAAAAGRVVYSGWSPGYGNLVEIEHGGGWITRYGHNAANLVAVGDRIADGQQIASVGQTGRATGNHLHFEVRRDGKAVRPEIFLGSDLKGGKLSAKA
jgi:murein DD-endopeptidase MepM/ murein hydrolase activator NlpD